MSSLPPLSTYQTSTDAAQFAAVSALSGGAPSVAADPAGTVINTGVLAQLGSNAEAQQNITSGLSLVGVAGGALSQITQSLQAMRTLAVAAADGTNNASDLQSLQQQFGQLSQGIDQLAGGTQFNGQQLLNGGYSATIQTGPNAGDTQAINLGNVSAGGLGIGGLNLSAAGGPQAAIQQIDQALSVVGKQQSSIGATQAGLNSSLANLSNSYENLAATQTDPLSLSSVAQQSMVLAQTDVQQQAQLKVEKLYNADQGNVLQLLGGVDTVA